MTTTQIIVNGLGLSLIALIVWYFWPTPELVIMQIALSIILFWRHRSNIRNLLQGSEGRIKNDPGTENSEK